jgi:hypothetical protein
MTVISLLDMSSSTVHCIDREKLKVGKTMNNKNNDKAVIKIINTNSVIGAAE